MYRITNRLLFVASRWTIINIFYFEFPISRKCKKEAHLTTYVSV